MTCNQSAVKMVTMLFFQITQYTVSKKNRCLYTLACNIAPNTLSLSNSVVTHPFDGPLSGTTRVSRYQKGKTSLDFTEARDSEWQWHQLGMCKSAPRSRQITMPAPHHSVFYRPDALPAAQPTVSEH